MFISLDHLHEAMAKQKEEEMNAIQAIAIETGSPESETKRQRRHLLDRLDVLYMEHKGTLQKKYGLSDQDPPKTFKELRERIKLGHFTYGGKDKDETEEHWDATDYLRWRDPNLKEDKAGYDAAKKEMKKRYHSARDEIIVLSMERALDALRSFETLH